MSVTGIAEGEPGAGPMKVGPSIVDILCGLNAVIGITAALYHRDANGGTGQQVDLALYDSGVAAMSHCAQIYLTSGVVPFQRGTQGNGSVPSQMFYTRDGGLMLTDGNDNQFRKLCAALGAPQFLADPRFKDGPPDRQPLRAERRGPGAVPDGRHRPMAGGAVRRGRPLRADQRFPVGFRRPADVARGMKWSVAHPHAGSIDLVGNPLHF